MRGKVAMGQYGCPSCHVIPGIAGAEGTTGPPLTGIATRGFIAGVMPNTPDNMVRWIMDPPAVDSLTAMPALGISDTLARDIAAYLELPITDVLDLHSFRPSEVPDLVRDYLDAAYEKGLRDLRIIHGKGIGVQRKTVRTLLERDPRVEAFGDAPLEAGSWGATWVRLR